MAVKLADVALALTEAADDTARARAAVKALGLEVNEQTGEVYNPAEGSYGTKRASAPSGVPMQQGLVYGRYHTRRARR